MRDFSKLRYAATNACIAVVIMILSNAFLFVALSPRYDVGSVSYAVATNNPEQQSGTCTDSQFSLQSMTVSNSSIDSEPCAFAPIGSRRVVWYREVPCWALWEWRLLPPKPTWMQVGNNHALGDSHFQSISVGIPMEWASADVETTEFDKVSVIRGYIAVRGRTAVVIPSRILWTRFVASWFAFFIIVVLSWTFSIHIIRKLRRNRKACSNCGYSIHGLTVSKCPECGSETYS